jgi:chromosome partitioning protein
MGLVKHPMHESKTSGLAGGILNALDPLLRMYGERAPGPVTARPRVRVVFNQKGGVGKTTLAVNLASCAALSGQRTLLVDSDPNGNATTHLLGRGAPAGRTLADFYESCLGLGLLSQSLGEFVTAPTSVSGLHLCAADARLDELRPKLESRHKINKLRDALPGLPYDELYFDTPPVLDFFTLSSLIAADEVIVPIDCDAFSVQAAEQVHRSVQEIRQDHNPRLRLLGVVVNNFQRSTRHATRMVNQLRQLGLPVMQPYIPSSVKVRESHSQQRPLVVGHPQHAVAAAIKGLHAAMCSDASA